MHPSFPWEGRGLERCNLRFGRHAALRVALEIRRAGESALHERDHRGGDHPIPFRTRQLSPPSPKVLQRQAAGGQGVALMQGASAYPGPSGPFSFWGRKAPFLYRGGRFSPVSRAGPEASLRPVAIRQLLAAFNRLVPHGLRCLLEARLFWPLSVFPGTC